MAPVLAVINRKGGVGKTSATHNLAGVWGAWVLRVCLIDLDTAFNLTEACGYPEGAPLAVGIERIERLEIDCERHFPKLLAPYAGASTSSCSTPSPTSATPTTSRLARPTSRARRRPEMPSHPAHGSCRPRPIR
jgi:hypothetical protein